MSVLTNKIISLKKIKVYNYKIYARVDDDYRKRPHKIIWLLKYEANPFVRK